MAWPNSRLTNYLANSLPRIKAADLNALQDGVTSLITNGWTFKALQTDGTGGAAPSAAAGDIMASGNVTSANDLIATAGKLGLGGTKSSATPGAGQALTIGSAYKDSLIVGFAKVQVAGGAASLVWGINIASVTWNATGQTTVVLTNGPANFLIPFACLVGGFGVVDSVAAILINSKTSVSINTINGAGTNIDRDFSLLLVGG